MSTIVASTSWINILGLAVLLSVLYYIIQAIFTWRRLAHIPAASWISNFSDVWLASHTYSGKQYWMHKNLHKKHGPLVRVAPNMIVTDDISVLKIISGTDDNWWRDAYYKTGKFNPYHENLFSRLEPKEHRWAKARTIAAYSGRDTPDLEVGVNEMLKILIETIEERYCDKSAYLDLYKASNYLTMDVIMRLAFGKEQGYLREEKDHFGFLQSLHDLWPQMVTTADLRIMRKILFSPIFLMLAGPKPTDKGGFGALMGVAGKHVSKRFQPDAKPRMDMLGSMIKHGLNQAECETEGLFMIIAGTESTASAIRSAMLHTITSPHAYQRLKEEIRSAVQEGKASNPITMAEARQLPYLQAVVYEGIRMRPPIIGFFPKVVPPQGAEILGYQVPGGTAIGGNMSAILSSTELFGDDAEVFRPDRFMELEEADRKQMERSVELAFGHGQWMCVGKGVAMMEISKSVFEIFRHFDLQLVQPFAPSKIETYGTFLELDLKVRVTKAEL